jgi:hypothetical protein
MSLPTSSTAGRQPPAPSAAPAEGPARAALVTAAALALVLAFRALYLARFGDDPCWMNYNFLLEAKAMRFGYPAEFAGMPLARLLLYAARAAGASAAVALGAAYLAGQALLALGVFALARSVLGASPRARAAVALAVAVLPAFASDAGYRMKSILSTLLARYSPSLTLD